MWADRLRVKSHAILRAAGYATMDMPSGRMGIVGASAKVINVVEGYEQLLDQADVLLQDMWQWLPILEAAYEHNPTSPLFTENDAAGYLAKVRKRLVDYQAPIKAILEDRSARTKRPRE